jgi:hypothetical protein
VEASPAQAPAQPEQPVEPAAPEAAPPTPPTGQPDPAQPPEGAEQQPDVGRELAALRETTQRIEQEMGLGQEQAPGDLYESLTAPLENPEMQGQPGQPGMEQGQQFVDEQGNPVDQYGNPLPPEQQFANEEHQLRQLFREEAANLLVPQLRRQELNSYAEKHPDIRDPEVFEAVTDKLAPIAEAYGREEYTNPLLVDLAYKAVKAEAAAAAETPAEAPGQGPTLETGAGPSAPQGEPDPADRYKQAVFDPNKPQSVF